MKRLIPLILLAFLAAPAPAQEAAPSPDALELLPADSVNLNDFKWTHRPVIVFADADADPRYREQIALLSERPGHLAERDVVVIVDTDPAGMSAVREKLRPRGFMLVLIGKDGGVKLRKPAPWDVRELSRVIDKMPMRLEEIRLGR